jgi:hypothetical protein
MSVSIGAGTDIFVRKSQPGAAVGVGYWIDIFQNGVKIDSFRVETKKRVIEIVRKYKEKYHTDRSFLNESQTHITYKTKEERGETAMNLDQELIKKASTIHSALQKLLTPLLPVKIREAEAIGESIINPQGINFIPETPGQDASMSEEKIGPMIASKFVEFVNKNQPQQGQEWIKADDLYNPLKKWLTAIKKKINDYERMNNVQLDMQKISDAAEVITFSGDPQKIKESLKIDVTPDVAAKVKEVSGMKAGIRKKESRWKAWYESLDKKSEEELKDILEQEEKQEGPEEISELKEEFGGGKDDGDIRHHILSFLQFSKDSGKSLELGAAVSKWSNKLGISIEIAQNVLGELNNNSDIYKEAFFTNTNILSAKDYLEAAVSSGFLGKETLIKLVTNILNPIKANEKISGKEIYNVISKAFDSLGGESKMVEAAKNSIKIIMDRYIDNWMKSNKNIDKKTAEQGVSKFSEKTFNKNTATGYLYPILSGGAPIVKRLKQALFLSGNNIISKEIDLILGEIVRTLRSYVVAAFDNGSWVQSYIENESASAKNLQAAFEKVLTKSEQPEMSVSEMGLNAPAASSTTEQAPQIPAWRQDYMGTPGTPRNRELQMQYYKEMYNALLEDYKTAIAKKDSALTEYYATELRKLEKILGIKRI